ncbi:hypothetical protein RR48_10198 [Papilio machaon]|uniref:Uncharacterized protein n=1 Tax=Papilio machaon TaxID=76193 RepID=A0A194QZP6_PAPMA|nr:hypothetical protein RR48_10198 [Papilio machaon]
MLRRLMEFPRLGLDILKLEVQSQFYLRLYTGNLFSGTQGSHGMGLVSHVLYNPVFQKEHHLQRAISGTGLIIPTPEVCEVSDLEFYERCYPADYKMPKQHIHMQQALYSLSILSFQIPGQPKVICVLRSAPTSHYAHYDSREVRSRQEI